MQTLSDTKNVSTDFYKLFVQTTQGHQAVLALKTDGLGEYFGINYKMAVKFAAHFGLPPEDILCATSEPIDLLLGVDAAGLLLDKVMQLNGRDVKPASWAPNIFLYGSEASCKFSLVGRMNVNYPVDNIRDRFSAQGVF